MPEMLPTRAREVLLGMPDTKLSGQRLTNSLNIIESDIGDLGEGGTKIQLDGFFTADQLEAIAAWMRDPTAVSGNR